MLKPVTDFIKTILASYGRLTKVEDNIKKILTHSDEQDNITESTRNMLRQVLYEIDKDRAVAAEQQRTLAEQQRTAERDR